MFNFTLLHFIVHKPLKASKIHISNKNQHIYIYRGTKGAFQKKKSFQQAFIVIFSYKDTKQVSFANTHMALSRYAGQEDIPTWKIKMCWQRK